MNPFEQVLTAFVFLFVVFVPLERAFLANRQRVFRFEWGTDLLFFLGQYLLWPSLTLTVLVGVWHASQHLPIEALREAVAAQPLWLAALEVLLLGDFLVYWGHRLSHRVDFLWRFHRTHHTAERLDWLAAHREHPIDGIYTQLWQNLPAILLGFPVAAIAGVAVFRGAWAIFIHSNVRIPIGPLRFVLGSPELHHWHHERERGGRCNFANLMPLMDVIFGTYEKPGREPERLGIDEDVPRSYLGLLLDPFRRRRVG